MPIHDVDSEASRLTIEGRLLYLEYRQSENAKARATFQKARELDPEYADACGWLAYALQWAAREGWTPDVAPNAQSIIDVASQGVALDEGNYYMHWCLADVLGGGGGQFDAALERYDQAMSLGPSDDEKWDIQVEVADVLAYRGNIGGALWLIGEAQARRKNAPTWYLWSEGFAHFVGRDYDRAIAAIDKMEALVAAAGGNMPNPAILTRAAAQERRQSFSQDDAKNVVSRLRDNSPGWRPEDLPLMEPLEYEGDREHWLGSFEKLKAAAGKSQ
jgi:tetratricopeptide (TPR) repeat protein